MKAIQNISVQYVVVRCCRERVKHSFVSLSRYKWSVFRTVSIHYHVTRRPKDDQRGHRKNSAGHAPNSPAPYIVPCQQGQLKRGTPQLQRKGMVLLIEKRCFFDGVNGKQRNIAVQGTKHECFQIVAHALIANQYFSIQVNGKSSHNIYERLKTNLTCKIKENALRSRSGEEVSERRGLLSRTRETCKRT